MYLPARLPKTKLPEAGQSQGLRIPCPTVVPTWYWVQKGRTLADTGIYDSFQAVQQVTAGVPGAIFQAFPTAEQAQEFVEQSLTPVPAKWYIALVTGNRPTDTGVYDTWDQVQRRIRLCPNPIYQSFLSLELAQVYISKYQAPPPAAPQMPRAATFGHAGTPSAPDPRNPWTDEYTWKYSRDGVKSVEITQLI